MIVSFGSVTILAAPFDAPDTFLENAETTGEVVLTTFTAISVGSAFGVVGAATGDRVFSR